MRELMENKALAGKSWTAPTTGRDYSVDEHGLASIHADDPDKETKDLSEAKAAGFVVHERGERVTLKNAAFAKRRKFDERLDRFVEVGPSSWVAEKTNHHYQADEDGKISAYSIDADEAKAAGFEAA